MAKRPPRMQSRWIPVWGTVVAGPLSGWTFSFLQFVRVGSGLALDLRCTPPDWPFPADVRFTMGRDRFALAAGPSARRLNAQDLMQTAMELGFARAPFNDR